MQRFVDLVFDGYAEIIRTMPVPEFVVRAENSDRLMARKAIETKYKQQHFKPE
jgi:hypothetical protein